MKKIIFIFLIAILVIATTVTKNSTKKIDKQIYETKENLRILRDKYEYVLLDYNYLSSPEKLMEYQIQYFENDLTPLKIENFKKIIFEKDSVILLASPNMIND